MITINAALALTLSGLAIGADRTPADFAEITADCNRVVCKADAKGEFRCEVALPPGGAFCIEHPRFGRKRIDLDGRRGEVRLGVVQLIEGAVIRVVRPPHVELPEGSTVFLLRDGSPLGDAQTIGSRDVLEFVGLGAGKYAVVLAGPEPTQRKQFPVEVTKGETQVFLSIDAYRLTGEVEYDHGPLEATVTLQGGLWTGELKSDADGRFNAELWQPEDFLVSIETGVLPTPYMLMKSASPSDSQWRLRVPSRRIRGRVYDAETRKAVAWVSLMYESDSEETRGSRPIEVKEDGTFEVAGVGDGQYSIIAHADGYIDSDTVELDLKEFDGDQSVELPLWRGVNVDLAAVDAHGGPVANALVFADGKLHSTDASGHLTLALKSSSEEKSVFILPREGSMATARISARDAEGGARVVVLPGDAKLVVEAKSTDGEPLAGVGFALRWGGVELPNGVLHSLARLRQAALTTDAAGNLAVSALPPGTYEIAWREPGGRQLGNWMRVELVAGETVIAQKFAKAAAAGSQ